MTDTTLSPTVPQWVASALFAVAIIHTFLVQRFADWSHQAPKDSVRAGILHLLSEVEVVFGLWAGIYILILAAWFEPSHAVQYLNSLNFTEPAFVFVIMTLCATRPIIEAAKSLIAQISKLLPLPRPMAFYATTLTVGPILGSLITEPAAMTVCALILLERYFTKGIPQSLKYATLGLLFVNISIGGTWTPYAAPPILMVAPLWDWDLAYMLQHFGWKGGIAALLSTAWVCWRYRADLNRMEWEQKDSAVQTLEQRVPFGITLTHLSFLALVVVSSHHMVIFAGVFLFFMGLYTVTRKFQTVLKLREGLLVGFFLAGLVVLGTPQRWWLESVLTQLGTLQMYLGAITLTAFTDNAALTYLGAQVPSLSEATRYALVAGAVVGGGLTVIANAPNPAGFGILNASFGRGGISPMGLFKAALFPTVIAGVCYWML